MGIAEDITTIRDLAIRKVFNSRGEETVEVEVELEGGYGRAAAPAGASRGKHEVVYFPGDNVDEALEAFEKYVVPELVGLDAAEQVLIDLKLEDIDGTENFSRIGGAVAIATSMASARAAADALAVPLFRHIGGFNARYIPYPVGNVIGGGKHSRWLGPDVQEFLVIPVGAPDIYTAVKVNFEIHRRLLRELHKVDPTFTGGRNDEGAWTPRISTEKALDVLSKVVKEVEKDMDVQVRLGIDVAASSLWDDKKQKYIYRNEGVERTPREQLEYMKYLIEKYDIFYIEDPFHEEDFSSFAELTSMFPDRLIVGDDIFVTNVSRLERGIRERAANAIIIKPDQIGTLTRAKETIELALRAGYTPIVSHRSGETEYGLLAHIAVGFRAPLIKTGVCGGERVAKLNELIRIWDYLGRAARMAKIRTVPRG